MKKAKGIRSRISQVWLHRLILAVKIVIATGLILFLFTSGRLNFALIIDSYKYPIYLFSGALCCTLAMVTPIFRWWILTRVQKLPLGAFDALRLTMIGYFFNMFIPGGAGGDVVRAAYTVRDCPERRAQALTIAFVDRGLGLHALLLMGVSLIFIQPALFSNHAALKPWILLITAMLIVGTIVTFMFDLGTYERVYDAFLWPHYRWCRCMVRSYEAIPQTAGHAWYCVSFLGGQRNIQCACDTLYDAGSRIKPDNCGKHSCSPTGHTCQYPSCHTRRDWNCRRSQRRTLCSHRPGRRRKRNASDKAFHCASRLIRTSILPQ
jgi:hypothetical protein